MVFTDIHTVDENSNLKEVFLGDASLYDSDPGKLYDLLVTGNRIAALSVIMRKFGLLETWV